MREASEHAPQLARLLHLNLQHQALGRARRARQREAVLPELLVVSGGARGPRAAGDVRVPDDLAQLRQRLVAALELRVGSANALTFDA